MGATGNQIKIEPPYGVILDELRHGSAVPFLGAAASLSADGTLPSGSQLAEADIASTQWETVPQGVGHLLLRRTIHGFSGMGTDERQGVERIGQAVAVDGWRRSPTGSPA